MKISIISDKKLSKSQMNLMNKWRRREFGPNEVKNFKKDYLPGAKFFFVKDNDKVVAFGALRDVTINYLGRNYKILGICNIISIEKGKGYGKVLIQSMIKYLKKKGKTGLGFCGREKTEFYKKAGLKTKKLFGRRFALKNQETGEIKFEEKGDEGDGLWYDGKDKLINKMLRKKGIGYYYLPNIKSPHW